MASGPQEKGVQSWPGSEQEEENFILEENPPQISLKCDP